MQEEPSSLLEDVKYFIPAIYMTRMKTRWNLLDFDEFLGSDKNYAILCQSEILFSRK